MKNANRRSLVIFALVCVLGLAPYSAQAAGFDKFMRALKGVAWSAISVGVDEAGSRLLGPTIWNIVKRVGEPALRELNTESRTPDTSTVNRVVYLIDHDTRMRNMIKSRFNALPDSERIQLVDKIDQIEEHLVRIENLARDTNFNVREIKQLLVSVLRTPGYSRMPLSSVPKGLSRYDAHDSLLSIYYPRNMRAPRKYEDGWAVGGRAEQSALKAWMDDDEPTILYRVLGVPKSQGSTEAENNKQMSMDAVREMLAGQGCDEEDQQFKYQELSKETGVLYVGMCDRNWPVPNTYVAVRWFYSKGASVYIRAWAVGTKIWDKYEEPLISALKHTELRGPCGFYQTACCVPEGIYACEQGLSCQRGACLPSKGGE